MRPLDVDWEVAAQPATGPVNITVTGQVGQLVTTGGQVTNIGSTVGGSVDWSNHLKAALDQLRWELADARDLSAEQRAEVITAIEDVEEARADRPERLGSRLHGLVSVLKALAPYAAAGPQWIRYIEPFLHAQ